MARERVVFIFAVTIEGEVFFFNAVVFWRLDAENKFAVHEALPIVVQQHGIVGVAERITHAGGHKNVFVTVRIEVGDGDAPRPVGLGADLV